MNFPRPDSLSVKKHSQKYHHLHNLRREYTSKTLIEFLRERKMNFCTIFSIKLGSILHQSPHITLKQASSIISSSKNLKVAKIDCIMSEQSSEQDKKIFIQLLISLRGLKALSKLTLLVYCTGDFSKEFDVILSILKTLKSLKYLKLTFYGKISSENLKPFLFAIRSLRFLTKLCLVFSSFDHTDASLKNLSFTLRRFHKLSILDLCLHTDPSAVTDQGIHHLSSALKGMRLLTSISLVFPELKTMSDQGLVHLSDALRDRHNLVNLHLNLPKCQDFTDDSLLYLASVLEELEILSHARISLFQYDENSSYYIQGLLSCLKNIKSISLPLHNVIPKSLYNGLSGWSQLTDLNLSFFMNDRLTDEILQSLSLSLQSLQKLSTLALVLFGGRRFTNQGLKDLSLSFQRMDSLASFEIDFYWCDEITDAGYNALLDGLKDTKRLKSLKMIFKYTNVMTDSTLESLSLLLDHVGPSLTALEIHLMFCGGVTGQGLRNLSHGLRKLQMLSHASLDISFCNKIDSQGYQSLLVSLEDLRMLKSLVLSGRNCIMIDDQTINSLSSSLKSISSLEILHLNFSRLRSKY